MSAASSRRKSFDTCTVGLRGEDLPPLADSPKRTQFDLRSLWPKELQAQPIELEIGSGKGTFLLQQAKQITDVNFLGIEYAFEFWRYAADRIRRHGLPNIRLLHYDAKVFVQWYIPDESLRQIHIYFPDPWPKRRHNKRRMVQEQMLRQCHRVLEQNGLIQIVTDHNDYFQWMQEHVSKVEDLFKRLDFESPVSANEDEVVGTNFERKYRREGRPFYGMTLRKITSIESNNC